MSIDWSLRRTKRIYDYTISAMDIARRYTELTGAFMGVADSSLRCEVSRCTRRGPFYTRVQGTETNIYFCKECLEGAIAA